MLERLPHAEKPWIENYAILLRPVPGSASVQGKENELEKQRPRLIGAVGVIRFDPGSGAEVGYGIHPGYQGKGYATEALRLFVEVWWSKKSEYDLCGLYGELKYMYYGMLTDWTLGEGDWNTLVAAIDPENTASERVVQKVGFTRGELQDEGFEMWSESGKGRVVRHREWLLVGPE
jgi:RimJ/RimL family protein N-acetyltransferase